MIRNTLAIVLPLFAAAFATSNAFAHAMLETASPSAGTIILSAPSDVVLHFSEGLEPQFSSVKISDAGTNRVDNGAAQIDGKTMRIAVGKLPPGLYHVDWRALSEDGHRTEGSYTFRIAQPNLGNGPLSPVAAITIEQAWSRATPPGAPNAAGYLRIVNNSRSDDRLLDGSSPDATKVEIHSTKFEKGVAIMRLVDGGVPIAAGGSISMAPNGSYHLMFVSPKPFKAGDHIPVTLHFAKAGNVDVMFTVEAINATGPSEEPNAGAKTNAPMVNMPMH